MINYHADNFNCAHYAIGQINLLHNLKIDISNDDTWQAKFIKRLRKEFNQITRPQNNCLVLMYQFCGGLHLGIYQNNHVKHNYDSGLSGCVIMSDMGTIRSLYKKVKFYEPKNKNL